MLSIASVSHADWRAVQDGVAPSQERLAGQAGRHCQELEAPMVWLDCITITSITTGYNSLRRRLSNEHCRFELNPERHTLTYFETPTDTRSLGVIQVHVPHHHSHLTHVLPSNIIHDCCSCTGRCLSSRRTVTSPPTRRTASASRVGGARSTWYMRALCLSHLTTYHCEGCRQRGIARRLGARH